MTLAKPYAKLDYYHDALVLAYPSLPSEGPPQLVSAMVGYKSVDPKVLIDWDLTDGIDVRPEAPGQPAYLLLEYASSFEIRSILMHATNIGGGGRGGFGGPGGFGGGVPPSMTLESSDDGITFRKVIDLAEAGGRGGAGPNVQQTASFPPVRAKFFRLSILQARRISELQLSGAGRIADWTFKTNLAHRRNQEQTPSAEAGPTINPEQVVDLAAQMDSAGRLSWQAPSGRWTILRIGSTPTGRMQNAASDAGLGLEIDKFNAEAMEFHFDKYFGKLYKDFAPLAAKGLVGALIDSYEVGMQNWTPAFPEEFQKRRGYDLRKYMPAITGRVVGSPEITERFLWDFRRAQADLCKAMRCTAMVIRPPDSRPDGMVSSSTNAPGACSRPCSLHLNRCRAGTISRWSTVQGRPRSTLTASWSKQDSAPATRSILGLECPMRTSVSCISKVTTPTPCSFPKPSARSASASWLPHCPIPSCLPQ